MDIFEKVKENVDIVKVVEAFGVKLNSKHQGLCPFHHEKTPSFTVDPGNQMFKCFGCGVGGDAIKFVEMIKGIEPIDAAKLLAEMYHIDIEDRPKSKGQLITEYLKKCIADIDKTDYFQKRGLKASTIKNFRLGYDAYRKAVVIPYSSQLLYYQTRGTEEKTFYKPKTEDAGPEPIYNIEAMRLKTKEPIFIVESPICAMSVVQSGGNAIATCGTSGWKKVIDEVKKKKPLGGFIVCMDNDEPGRAASKSICDAFRELAVHFVPLNIAGECKDPNELLMQSPKTLEENIANAKKELRKKYATAKDSFNALELQMANIEPPTWIVQDVLPTGLAMLCAPSKIGKSWMMLQLGLAVSEGKTFLDFKTNQNGVLYYALEDSKGRIKDRMTKMLKGKRASTDLHFTLSADTIDNGFLEKITDEIKIHPNIKLVIVDTLQKVRGKVIKNESVYSGDYREMGGLKEFADNNKICLLFVHHLRKLADESDVFNMISGSTALMGAADTIFIISKKKRMEDSATLSMTGRDIQQSDLVIQFDKADHKWVVQGTAEEVALRKEREEYENSPIITTIKELVKQNPVSGWKGSAEDLTKAVFDVTGKQIEDSATVVGKTIKKFERKLYYDDIEHTETRSSSKRAHVFKKRVKDTYGTYQRSFYDRDDEE